jgi:hypothetical protein
MHRWVAGLLVGGVVIVCYNPPSKRAFVRSLGPHQRKAFSDSQRERALASAVALGLGWAAATLAWGRGWVTTAGGVAATVVGVCYMGYQVWPFRSPLMVEVLESKEQARLWSAAYKDIKRLVHAGMLAGIAAACLTVCADGSRCANSAADEPATPAAAPSPQAARHVQGP